MSRMMVSAIVALIFACVLPTGGPAQAFERELEARAGSLARSLEEAGVESVAVVDFTDLRGRATELGRFLAEELSAKLVAAAPDLRIVDRMRLAPILKERKLSSTGLIDAESAGEVARIAGVEALVTGRLTPFRDTVRVSLLVLREGSAEVVASQVADVPRTGALAELESRSLTVSCEPGIEGGELSLDGPPLQRVEREKFAFDLHGCAWVGRAVHCGLAVRSRGDDRNLYLSGKTRAVFEKGRQVQASRMSLGGHRATGTLSRVGSPLLEGVPTSLGVVFEGVPEEVEALRFLNLDFRGLEVQFRDVPVQR